MTQTLELAHATLGRGARFLGAGLTTQEGCDPLTIAGRYRTKVIGNGLRELDRFLNLLLDEASLRIGQNARPGERNTANKLRRFRAAFGDGSAEDGSAEEDARLRALARSRDCLFHSGGLVTRGDLRGESRMTVGWNAPDHVGLRSFAVGEALVMTADDIASVCAFYQALAGEVVERSVEAVRSRRTARRG